MSRRTEDNTTEIRYKASDLNKCIKHDNAAGDKAVCKRKQWSEPALNEPFTMCGCRIVSQAVCDDSIASSVDLSSTARLGLTRSPRQYCACQQWP